MHPPPPNFLPSQGKAGKLRFTAATAMECWDTGHGRGKGSCGEEAGWLGKSLYYLSALRLQKEGSLFIRPLPSVSLSTGTSC